MVSLPVRALQLIVSSSHLQNVHLLRTAPVKGIHGKILTEVLAYVQVND